jgi:hypothetical protein
VSEREPLATALAALLADASASIAAGLTEDPAGVAGPIALPDGMTNEESAERLAQMARIVHAAAEAASLAEARRILSSLFGVEIDEIRARHQSVTRSSPLNPALRSGNTAAVGAALGAPELKKTTRSHGGSWCP